MDNELSDLGSARMPARPRWQRAPARMSAIFGLAMMAMTTATATAQAPATSTSTSTSTLAQADVDAPVTRNDSDGDGVVDTVDIDDDADGIPDDREIAADGSDRDSDGDGRPDRLDLDSDNDGIVDWREANAAAVVDVSSLRNVAGRLIGEVGENGLLDVFEYPLDTGNLVYTVADTDRPSDGLPDHIDLDADNDGWSDLAEAGVSADLDRNGDGRIDAPSGSVGNDGIVDRVQRRNDATCCDVTGDGVDDDIPRDTDGQGTPDYVDLDSDDDGVPDVLELGGDDVDGDGRFDNFVDNTGRGTGLADGFDDGLAFAPLIPTDRNGNGVEDQVDAFAPDPTGGAAVRPILAADAARVPGEGAVRTAYGSSGCSIVGGAGDAVLPLYTLFALIGISLARRRGSH